MTDYQQPPPQGWPTPTYGPADRVVFATQRRYESDYIFSFWTAFGWTLLTCGIYGYYVIYQMVRRMRDHNARRLELLDAALAFSWEEAGKRGLQDELTPSYQRAGAHLAVMRSMTTDFREPWIWLIICAVAGGIGHIVLFIFLDQDLVKHDTAEVGVEYELSLIFERLGHSLPPPDQSRVKGQHNYVGRIIASVLSLGIYAIWWQYNMMTEPNRHFQTNWEQEDALSNAVQVMRQLS